MLRLLLLGRPQIILNGQPVVEFVSEKALALLCYLVVQRGMHARGTLAGLFWGEMPEARARANLRMALYNLQQLIPGYLIVTRLEVGFNRQMAYLLDVEELNGEVTRWKGNAVQPAPQPLDLHASTLQLFRGDFLEGLYIERAHAFEEWLLFEREHLRHLALQVSQQLADQALRQGSYPLAIQALRRLLRIDAWQESAHRQLMLALARSGDATGALAQFSACRRALASGLGIEPMPETTALAERIRLARQRGRRHNLPPQPVPFVGRSGELASLHQLFNQPEARLITLTGPGGIGKTRLALQAAAELANVFFEGVYFIPFDALTSTESIAPAILAALEFPLQGGEDPHQQLCDVLHDQEMLVVLDGFEHLLEGAEMLAELLSTATGVRFLVTSRERLRLQWEITFPVDGLEFPWDGELETLEKYSAVQFFIQCSRRARPNFTLSTTDQAAMRQLCRITEGMPLALELAAAWVPTLSLAAIADAVQHNLDFLASNQRDAPAHHRSVQAAIEKSWELLSAAEKDVFRRLAIFRGGFTLEAAQQVTGASQEALARLAAKSLLRQNQAGRYDLHEMLRQFAAGKLDSAQELCTSLSQQHSRYFCAFLQQREHQIISAGMAETIREIRGELENVHAAWCWAGQQGDLISLADGLRCLSQFYEVSSLLQEGESAFSLAVEGLRSHPAPHPSPQTARILGMLLIEQARFQGALTRHEQAIQALAEALRIIGAHPDPAAEAAARLQWAEILERQGDYAAAGEQYTLALALAQANGIPALQSSSHLGLGIVAGEGGDIAGASTHFNEALQLSRSAGDRRGENAALHNLAIAAMYQNDKSGAQHYFKQELELAQRLGNRRLELMSLLALKLLAEHHGDTAGLQRYSEQALQICQETGERRETGTALDGLGLAALYQGRFDEASLSLGQALRSHREAGNRQGECTSRMYLSLIQRALGDFSNAQKGLEEVLAVLRELKTPADECRLLAHLSVTEHLLGEHASAYQRAQLALVLSKQIGDRSFEADALAALGRALEGMGKPEEAAAAQQEALEHRLAAGQPHLALESTASLALLALAQGHLDQAQALADEILRYLDGQPIQGLEPFRVYLAAYRVLRPAQDHRAPQLLKVAYDVLQEQAGSIHQISQRNSFLERVPVNQTLIQAWKVALPD
jgi:predicted ATPase/DNA-binding SARP family transcriptional activator